MITRRPDLKVVLATQPIDFRAHRFPRPSISAPIDFRKGVHGLVALVAEALKADPYYGDVFDCKGRMNQYSTGSDTRP